MLVSSSTGNVALPNEFSSPAWCWPISPDWRCYGVANRIRELREERGLTLEGLAELVGTSFQQISRLEKSHRRLSEKWMRPIAKALGVAPGDLLADTPPDPIDIAQQTEQFLVWRVWSAMSLDDKKFLATWAKGKGIDILSRLLASPDKPKRRGRRA